MFRSVQNSLLSLIYPQQCRVCSNSVDDLNDGVSCKECWDNTRIFSGREMLCNKCGALLGEKAADVAVRCLKCDDYHFERALAAGVYENALAASIIEAKTSPHLDHRIRSLIRGVTEREPGIFAAHLIIPVPLSKQRKIERGFNQAELIAIEIGRIIRKPVDTESLSRQINTRIHRAGMDQKARELTVKNAFTVLRPKLVADKNILLVDDVLTSGATTSSCARALKKHGSGTVNVFTLARAVLH
ncbi:MAG TPA: double zinc ribbon domain-containing protein [Pyrinomonadaceae bacterium]|nr:ComF family protein [Acidobacteriota bacterium]HQZ94869.1 double zinc ribbon domain-containing protein [Pyrinomonadaceae bacterium]